MNRLLARQVAKYLGDIYSQPENVKNFIEAINLAYEQFEQDRNLMERSLELSSQELREHNDKLNKDAQTAKNNTEG